MRPKPFDLTVIAVLGPVLGDRLPLEMDVFAPNAAFAATPRLAILDAAARDRREAQALIGRAEFERIPVVLWDETSAPPMTEAASCAMIVVPDAVRADAYAAVAPGVPTMVVAPWVQPALFHPFRQFSARKGMPLGVGMLGVDADLPVATEAIDVGTAPAGLAEAVRRCSFVMVDPRAVSPGLLLEIACCGAVVLDVRSSAEDLRRSIAALSSHPESRERLALARRRAIWRSDTLSHRMNAVLAALGVDGGWRQTPLASMVMATQRPWLLPQAIACFKRQTWPAKEFVVVVHGDTPSEHPLEEGVRVIPLARERNIGTLLNLAVDLARGEHCIKMDDDDLYGTAYLEDMLMQRLAIDADVYGKPPAFIYFEASGNLYRRGDADMQHTVGGGGCSGPLPRISGATLSGRTSALRRIGFSDLVAATSDHAFHAAAVRAGARVCATDPYGTVVFRSADLGAHTWRNVGEDSIAAAGRHIGQGRAAAQALLEDP